MDDFLTKPVDPAALRAVLGRWLDDVPEPESRVSREDDRETREKERTMAIEGLDLARLDELRDLDPGNTSYLDRAIGNFVNTTPGTFTTIREACEAGDAHTLKQVVHKLAGGALNLGVTPAGRIAQQIELAVDAGATEDAAGMLGQLERALEQGRAAVLAYQASYSSAG
jgi:HPt (histidine-containing phosphotransfer) domain-containing protein